VSIFVELAKNDRQLFREARRGLQQESRRYPKQLRELPLERNRAATNLLRVWRSSEFMVQLYDQDGHLRLSINRTAVEPDGHWQQGITWDDLQRLKSEAGFDDRWAVEVFPPGRHVTNVANIRHLFLLPEAPPFGWIDGKAVRP
jgi:hypothetical protein